MELMIVIDILIAITANFLSEGKSYIVNVGTAPKSANV